MFKAAIEYLLKLFVCHHRLVSAVYALILPPGDRARDSTRRTSLVEEITLFIISWRERDTDVLKNMGLELKLMVVR